MSRLLMLAEKAHRPSVLIVLAALDAKRPGPMATLNIGPLLEEGENKPVYGPNLRASCRRLEQSGLLRTRAVTGIDGDVKLNRTLWVMTENMLDFFGR
ncbi:hypothetical protein [Acinetobacter baumannii]|uniref:hypothetical protein n=1 Tax=Acinetobacter baumannii TaxID=470 RepID=UPI0038929C3D